MLDAGVLDVELAPGIARSSTGVADGPKGPGRLTALATALWNPLQAVQHRNKTLKIRLRRARLHGKQAALLTAA